MARETALLAMYQLMVLHQLANLGLDQRDDELADWLRDEMDISHRQLTNQEQLLLNELSDCLNTARDRRERRDEWVDMKRIGQRSTDL